MARLRDWAVRAALVLCFTALAWVAAVAYADVVDNRRLACRLGDHTWHSYRWYYSGHWAARECLVCGKHQERNWRRGQ